MQSFARRPTADYTDPVMDQKNVDGSLGPRCANCSGLGFTIAVTGGAGGCARCDKTGIEPVSNAELVARIRDLELRLNTLDLIRSQQR